MKTTFIYSLNDPITNEPKYIGKTNNLHVRVKNHLRNINKTNKSQWIINLKTHGLIPLIEIIDEVDINEWDFWEQHYISLYKSWGFNLLNMTLGGDGVFIPIRTSEWNNKISIANKGKIKSREHCKNISLSKLGKPNPIGIKIMADHNRGKKRPDQIPFLKERSKNIPIFKSGKENPYSREIIQLDINAIKIASFFGCREASKATNCDRAAINRCCNGEYRHTKGLYFKYGSNADAAGK